MALELLAIRDPRLFELALDVAALQAIARRRARRGARRGAGCDPARLLLLDDSLLLRAVGLLLRKSRSAGRPSASDNDVNEIPLMTRTNFTCEAMPVGRCDRIEPSSRR